MLIDSLRARFGRSIRRLTWTVPSGLFRTLSCSSGLKHGVSVTVLELSLKWRLLTERLGPDRPAALLARRFSSPVAARIKTPVTSAGLGLACPL